MRKDGEANRLVEKYFKFSRLSVLAAAIACFMVIGFLPATGHAVYDPPAPPPLKVDVQINKVTFHEDQDNGGGDAEPQLIWILDAGIHGGATNSFSKDDLNSDDFDDEIAIWDIYENIWTHEECFPRSEVTLTTRLIEMDTIASDETLKWVVTAAFFLLTEGKLPPWAEKIPGIGELIDKLKNAVVELIKELGSWINSNDDLGEGQITWGADGFYDIQSVRDDETVPATINAGLITTLISDPQKYNLCLTGEIPPPVDITDVVIPPNGSIDIFSSVEPTVVQNRLQSYPLQAYSSQPYTVSALANSMFSMLKTAATVAAKIEAEPDNPDQLTNSQVQDIRDTYIHVAFGLAEVVSGTYVEAARDFSGVQKAVIAFQKGRQLAAGGNVHDAIDAYELAFNTALEAIESNVSGGARLPLQIAMTPDIVSTEGGKRPLLLMSVLGSDNPQLGVRSVPAGVNVTVSQSDQPHGIFLVEMEFALDVEPGTYEMEFFTSDGNLEVDRKLKLIINGQKDEEPPVAGTVFFDDFESYDLGGMPTDWDLVYNGRGDAYQGVGDMYAFSGSQALQLWGQYRWSAVAQRLFDSDTPQIGYRYKILIDAHGSLHEEHPGFFKNHGESYWGTYYAIARFDHATGRILAEDGTVLGEWEPGVWYDVRVELNREEKTYSVSIDGNEVGGDLPINAGFPELIDAMALVSGHAGVRVFYDDVEVFIPDDGGDADDLCPDSHFGIIDVNSDGCPDTQQDILIFIKAEPVELIHNPDKFPPYTLRWKQNEIYLEDLNLIKRLTELLEAIEAIRAATDMTVEEKLLAIRLICIEAEIIARYAVQQGAIDLGEDHPDVIEALELFKKALEFAEGGRYEECVGSYRQSVITLSGEPNPSLKVEIMPRWEWEVDTETFAAIAEWVWLPIRVTNDGNVDLIDVTVDQSYSGFFEKIDLLRAGQTVILNSGSYLVCSLYKVQASDPDPFTIITKANGWAAIGGATQTAGASAICDVDVIHPQLGIIIKGPDTARVGEIISFEIEIVNQGDVPLYDIMVEEHTSFPTLNLLIQINSLQPGESSYHYYHYYVTNKDRGRILVSLFGSARRPYDFGIDYQLVSRSVYAAESHRVRVIRPVRPPRYRIPEYRP